MDVAALAANAKTVWLTGVWPVHKGEMNLRCEMRHFAHYYGASRIDGCLDRLLAARVGSQCKDCQEQRRKMPANHASHSIPFSASGGIAFSLLIPAIASALWV